MACTSGRRSEASLGPGAISSGATTVTLPRDLDAGTYYLFAVADDEDVVSESDVTNNVFRAPATLVVVRPDLTLDTLSASVTGARMMTTWVVIRNRVVGAPAGRVGLRFLDPTRPYGSNF